MKNHLAVIGSFLVIFAFSSVDSCISPMVKELSNTFQVDMNRVLLLISWCTSGTVIGILVGPALTASFRVSRLLGLSSAGLITGLSCFLMVSGVAATPEQSTTGLLFGLSKFDLALLSRTVFGLSSGVFAACMWWVTYYGVPKSHYQAMVAVLMSARPLATALGVPFAGILAADYSWSVPFSFFGSGIILGGIALPIAFWTFPEAPKTPFSLRTILNNYVEAFRIPLAIPYYLGLMINRMCYFGFYVISGIWFIQHFQLNIRDISTALFFIGLGEAIINFFVPYMLRKWGHDLVFVGSLILSGLLFPVFIRGTLPLNLTIAMITLFMLLDRMYSMALVVTIPQMFPDAGNKTVFGSLNTLTAWAGLTTIAWLGAHFPGPEGLQFMQILLGGTFWIGSLLLFFVQYKTVLFRKNPNP